MDKAILLAVVLIALSFALPVTILQISQSDYSFFVSNIGIFNVLTIVAVACFPIGALVIVVRVMQWAKFQFHKGTLFGLLLIMLGLVTLIVVGQLGSNNYALQIKFFNEYSFIIMGAFGSIFVGILILTIKTAIWGSKYIGSSGSKNST